MKKKHLALKLTLFAAVIALLSSSCSTPKDITYFQDMGSGTVLPVNPKPTVIEPNDRLTIVVKSKDPSLSALFNLPVVVDQTSGGTGATSTGLSAYVVSPKGTIDFPVLGPLKVEGMTRSELAGFIKGELIGKGLVKDPVVTVELLGNTFSVLGEVNHPGRISMGREQLNILQALAAAGDLSIQGKRENVTLMREEPDGLHTYRLDLTNLHELSQSPAFYIKQNDVIYVEPNNVRKRQATVNGNNLLSWSFWVSVASLLTTVAVLIVK